ncbi:MAG: Bug family tripartite tricarboxylate transporter substrate binding protein, partial [Betaproteobacteria bacterium]
MKPAATPQATAHSTNPSGPTPTAGPQRRQVLLGLASAVWAPGLAVAQGSDYPNRAINLVVGYPPGGSTDLTGRVVGAELAKQLGVQVVVENIGGAGGVLGAQKVVQAAADGYTLLLGANNET